MNPQSRVPPAWILSLPFLTFGMFLGFVIVTLPQMLAQQGVPGGRIAVAVAIITAPSFWSFLLAPFLDVRFRRRTYALCFGVLASAAAAFTVLHHTSVPETEAVMVIGDTSIALFAAAMGGWTGSLIEKSQSSGLGAWSAIFNISGGGFGILFTGYVTQHLSAAHAAALMVCVFLAPLLMFAAIPAPAPEATLANESYSRFAREVVSLLKRRDVLLALLLFTLPSASFALTNVLGGWGGRFHASPGMVSLLGGLGTVIAGIIGCSLVPALAARLPLRPLYLSIGFIGAAFTLGLLLLPRTPWAYGTAFVGENIFQSAAITAALAIIFEIIGPGNPLAATIYSLLLAAGNLPIVYMGIVDGHGYDLGGITGAFMADAVAGSCACILLAIVLRRWLFQPASVESPAPSTALSL